MMHDKRIQICLCHAMLHATAPLPVCLHRYDHFLSPVGYGSRSNVLEYRPGWDGCQDREGLYHLAPTQTATTTLGTAKVMLWCCGHDRIECRDREDKI